MVIGTLEWINGLFSVIFVAIATIIGLRIASKYFKHKKRTFLLMGFTWVLIVCPWWFSSASFLLALFTGEGLPLWIYILIGNIFVPLFSVFLLAAFTEMKYKEKQRIILSFFIIIGILFEIYLIYFIVVDPNSLGELQGIIDIEYRGILALYSEIKLKGKFLLFAFVLFTIGAIADAVLTLNYVSLPIIRITLISSSIMFYFGFMLPVWMKRLLIKNPSNTKDQKQ